MSKRTCRMVVAIDRAWALSVAQCLLWGALAFASPARAQGVPAPTQDPAPTAGSTKEVLTFWGVRQLEQDESVPDERKLEEWQAFVERAAEQIRYAKKAIDFWKNASRQRVFEMAGRIEGERDRTPEEKIAAWIDARKLYPKGRERTIAERRIVFWTGEETKRRVAEAEKIEKERRPKAERIAAWGGVVNWAKKGPELKAALKRIRQLQQQLYQEAVSADRIRRLAPETKLGLWREVLRGRPTASQRRLAERRIRALVGLTDADAGNGDSEGDDNDDD
ncbi:MAG: hypothetical protein H6729_06620 [Deltaproteobacteria bacterium]|nr:hypothetical protein [Deltaproteobacteria bacterium]